MDLKTSRKWMWYGVLIQWVAFTSALSMTVVYSWSDGWSIVVMSGASLLVASWCMWRIRDKDSKKRRLGFFLEMTPIAIAGLTAAFLLKFRT